MSYQPNLEETYLTHARYFNTLLTTLVKATPVLPKDRDSITDCPGVYLFSDHSNNHVYIGKTDRGLKIRINEHFHERKTPTNTQGIQQFLIDTGVIKDKGRNASPAAKAYMESNYTIRYLEIEDPQDRVSVEHYGIAVLQTPGNLYKVEDT